MTHLLGHWFENTFDCFRMKDRHDDARLALAFLRVTDNDLKL